MTLKEPFENSLFIRLGAAFAAGAALAWAVSQSTRVSLRDRDIAAMNQQIAKQEKTISELKALYEPYLKQISQLLADKQILEDNAKASQETFKKWQEAQDLWIKQNDQLQKLVNSYSKNCSIISEIRALDKRKATLDENVRFTTGHFC